jgi:DNA mismatch endonuclease (patch repair protein)
MDKLTKERRSWNMSRIRAKNTKPEISVRSMLHRMGYRFRVHPEGLPGRPDIVLPKHRTIIFVHGCFWHGHDQCKDFAPPKTRTEWWMAKISGNKQKDAENVTRLKALGWQVIVVWECELTPDRIGDSMRSVVDRLNN